ncbi:hypothetical protein PG993_014747 [Apiospora rasikravindrae]|uniref:Uncharacterized protein n=1 Tax=Apiospora rasikravindrae TaxID=990691 RepID=A0ABR1RNM1_9PEZI
MLWQKVAFMMGLIPGVALAATCKVSDLPILPRQTPGISISDNPRYAGGFVELPQHSSDSGPAVTRLEATLTVPNLTWASGQSSSGGPYILTAGCSVYAITDADSQAACNGRGAWMGVNANLSSAGQSQSSWFNWPPISTEFLGSDKDRKLNLTAGDEMFVTIDLLSATNATYSFMNLKDTNNTVTIAQDGGAGEPMCSGDGTTVYAGCYIGVTDSSIMPGFVEVDFESVLVYDRCNTTHDFDLDQQVQFYRLVDGNGKVLAMPALDEAFDFSVQWSENPEYGSGIDGGGAPPPPSVAALRW